MTPAQKDHLDQRETRVRKVIQGLKVTRVRKETQVLRGIPVKREIPDQKATPAT